jgi:RNA polymerase sigma-70 factor (ECF subfamily)
VPDYQTASDSQLVELALIGHDDAFRVLVDRYKGSVYACAYALTRRPADAADVTQETFIRFHKHLKQFDRHRELKPYLMTIAANTAKTWLAKQASRREVREPDAVIDRVADHRPAPGIDVAQRERRQVVRTFLDKLPETMRRICVMFYLGEQSCRDVAAALGMTENAVKVNLHRARKRLMHSGLAAWRTP